MNIKEFKESFVPGSKVKAFYDAIKERMGPIEEGSIAFGPKVTVSVIYAEDESPTALLANVKNSIYRATVRFADTYFNPMDLDSVYTGSAVLKWLPFIEIWLEECSENERIYHSDQTAFGLMFREQVKIWKELRDEFMTHFDIKERTTLVVWSYIYNPFTMGGNLTTAKGFEIQLADQTEVHLGRDYYGYILKSPKGQSVIVETESGAIVGTSFSAVVEDIQDGEPEYMRKQLEKAKKEHVSIISEDEFWRLYK